MDTISKRIDIEAKIDGKECSVSLYAHQIVAIEWTDLPVICCAGGQRYQVTDEFARTVQDELENLEA